MEKYRKLVAALVGAAATAALQFWGPDTSVGRWLTIAVALATALGVFAVPNEPAARR
jgi:hypothetical protein